MLYLFIYFLMKDIALCFILYNLSITKVAVKHN
jgi:hypothetical protein